MVVVLVGAEVGEVGVGGRVGYGGNGSHGKWHTPDGFQFGGGSGIWSRGDGVGGGGGGRRSADARSLPKLAKKKVSSARRVWGTMSMGSESAVKGAVERICGISSIHVRRKISINSRGGRCWWFVLHDDEGVLCSLES